MKKPVKLQDVQTATYWNDIPGFPDYQINKLSEIKSLSRLIQRESGGNFISKERILKHRVSGHGYNCVALFRDKKRTNFKVSALMSIVFFSHKPTKKMVVDHIDNDKTNDKLNNLQVITDRENLQKDKWRKGTSSKYPGVYWHKLAEKWTAQIFMSGKKIHLGLFESELSASEKYNLTLKQSL